MSDNRPFVDPLARALLAGGGYLCVGALGYRRDLLSLSLSLSLSHTHTHTRERARFLPFVVCVYAIMPDALIIFFLFKYSSPKHTCNSWDRVLLLHKERQRFVCRMYNVRMRVCVFFGGRGGGPCVRICVKHHGQLMATIVFREKWSSLFGDARWSLCANYLLWLLPLHMCGCGHGVGMVTGFINAG